MLKSDKSDLTVDNSENKRRQSEPIILSHFSLLDLRVWRRLYSELHGDKSHFSLYNYSSAKLGNQHSVTSQSSDSDFAENKIKVKQLNKINSFIICKHSGAEAVTWPEIKNILTSFNMLICTWGEYYRPNYLIGSVFR